MTNPVGVQVTPDELTKAAEALRAAGRAVNDSLIHSEEPSMRNPAPYAEVMFGPADDVAAQYARLTQDLAGYVQSCTDRLNSGADVFAKTAVDFETLSAAHGRAMGGQ